MSGQLLLGLVAAGAGFGWLSSRVGGKPAPDDKSPKPIAPGVPYPINDVPDKKEIPGHGGEDGPLLSGSNGGVSLVQAPPQPGAPSTVVEIDHAAPLGADPNIAPAAPIPTVNTDTPISVPAATPESLIFGNTTGLSKSQRIAAAVETSGYNGLYY